MILPISKLYEGESLTRVTLNLMFLRAPLTGTIKSVYIYTAANISVGQAVFNLRVGGTAQWTGENRPTIEAGSNSAAKTGLNIAVTRGAALYLDLELPAQSGVAAPISLVIEIDDGISASVSDEQIQDVVGAMLEATGAASVSYSDLLNKVTIGATDTSRTDEEIQDIIGAMFETGSHLSYNYNDATGKLELDAINLTDEEIQDKVAVFLAQGTNVTIAYNDGANTLTLSSATRSDEEIQDVVAALLAAGSNVTLTYNDAGNTFTIAASPGSSVTNLDSLTDVAVSSPTTGQILVFNGTNWVNGANTPTGNGFSFFNPDAPYASPNTIDDDFTGSSLDSKWIRDTNGATPTLTFNTPYSHLCMKSQASACAYMQTAPSGDWKIRAKVFSNLIGADAGILVKFSTSSYHGIVLTGTTPLIYKVTGSSLASLSFSSAILSNTNGRGVVYLQIEKVGTVITLSYSFDGLVFFAESSNTSGITPTNVGIYQKSTSSTIGAYFDWFRLVDSSGFTGRQISI